MDRSRLSSGVMPVTYAEDNVLIHVSTSILFRLARDYFLDDESLLSTLSAARNKAEAVETESANETDQRPPDKIIIVRSPSIFSWLMNLFDPPPLASMTFAQKVARVFLLSATLVVGSVIVAMLGALGLYLIERAREIDSMPEFLEGASVIAVGVGVNTVCLAMLFQIKKADHKLIPPKS